MTHCRTAKNAEIGLAVSFATVAPKNAERRFAEFDRTERCLSKRCCDREKSKFSFFLHICQVFRDVNAERVEEFGMKESKKSTFFMVESNVKLDLKDLEAIEQAINKVIHTRGSAVISNMQYKKSAFY